MTHREIQDLLEAFHDRQLDEPIRRNIEDHLAGCGGCREVVDRLSLLSRSIYRPVQVPPTEFFVNRVMARIHDQRNDVSGVFGYIWQSTALALTALAMFLIVSGPSEERSVPSSRPCSTSTVLLAGSGARFSTTEGSSEPMDSLLDLPEEI